MACCAKYRHKGPASSYPFHMLPLACCARPCGRVAMWRPAVWPAGALAAGAGHGGGWLGLKTKNYGSRLPSEKRKMTI
jgi:hypothetical protein